MNAIIKNNGATVSKGTNFVSNSSAGAMLMANNMNPACLRTNTLLKKDEWMDLDKRVVMVATERLTIFNDLVGLGLTYDLGGLGVTVSQYETESDMTDASISMEADVATDMDNLDYELQSVPVPIIHKDFKIGIRQLEAARRMGSKIDMSTSDVATRKVAQASEDLIIKGLSKKLNGYNIYGLTTHPNRITGTVTGTWGDINNIVPSILNMIKAAQSQSQFGPYRLYVASDLAIPFYSFYSDGSGQNVMTRLKTIDLITEIKVADRLPAGTVILLQATTNTIDLATAQPIIPVEWNTLGGLVSWYKVMMAFAPRLKPDINGKLGVVHFTGA